MNMSERTRNRNEEKRLKWGINETDERNKENERKEGNKKRSEWMPYLSFVVIIEAKAWLNLFSISPLLIRTGAKNIDKNRCKYTQSLGSLM